MSADGTLTLLQPGLCTLVVDQGRPRTRSLGVPVGGAADRFSLAVGNALVGNDPLVPALEISLRGPQLVADRDLTCVIYGAPFEAFLKDRSISPNRPFQLPADQELSIHGTPNGLRAYFCVQGGVWNRPILDSQSTLAPLVKGARLRCRAGEPISRYLPLASFEWNRDPHVLRVLPAPQSSWFSQSELNNASFRVSTSSNRMGIRLEGEPLSVPARDLVSEPVCPGSIQVLRDGQLVILGVDGQTIGGYPKIAQVASVDVDKPAQLRPGDAVRFEWIDHAEARRLLMAKTAELQEWLTRLRATACL